MSHLSTRQTTCCFLRQWGKVYQDRELAMSVAGRWAPSWFPGSLQYHVEIHSKPSSLVGRPIWMVDWSRQNCPVQSHLGRCTDLDWTKQCAAGHGDPNQSMSIKLHRRWNKATISCSKTARTVFGEVGRENTKQLWRSSTTLLTKRPNFDQKKEMRCNCEDRKQESRKLSYKWSRQIAF